MELTGLTLDTVDDRLRVEAGVDVLAGRIPAPRLVVFRRGRPLLAVDGRPRRCGERWVDPIAELLYLARTLRARTLVLAFPIRLEPPRGAPPRFALEVVTMQRRWPAPAVDHRRHAFDLTPEGLLVWEVPERLATLPLIGALAQRALARAGRRGTRTLAALTGMLVEDGHRIRMVPELERRLARGPPTTS